MSRQHAAPILVPQEGGPALPLQPVQKATAIGGVTEAWIQNLVQAYPRCLPIAEIDPIFVDPVPLCTELNTPAGPIDNVMVTASGLPVLVECKLWRNPEGRREVVGQILDYAKELARWTASDLQREVAKRVPGEGNPLLRLLAQAGHVVDEMAFNDALTLNLRRGRFLLLIVGDGIREGVEAIADYLQRHLGLHFSLGLVEMPVFHHPSGDYLVAPRVLARTAVITRQVIALPEGMALDEAAAETSGEDREQSALSNEQQRFWSAFLDGLKLDDPEQSIPRPAKLGYLTFTLPAPQGSSWITVWRDLAKGQVGLTLGWTRGQAGEAAGMALVEDLPSVQQELAGLVQLIDIKGRVTLYEARTFGDLNATDVRAQAFEWLRERLNDWINYLRPRIRSLVADRGDLGSAAR